MPVTNTLKDAAYVAVGLGVLGFQRAQVRRNELTKQLEEQVKAVESQVADSRKTVADLASQLEGYVAPVRSQFETQLDAWESALPAQVQDLVKQARTVAHEAEESVRSRLGLVAA